MAGRHPRFVGEGHAPPADLAATRLAGWSPCFSPSRRAGVHARRTLAISKIGTLRHRRVRRDEASRPTAARVAVAIPVGPKAQNLFVGAGFTSPAGAFRRPTAAQRRLLGRRSRPERFRRHEVPGTMQASSPTKVAIVWGHSHPVWPRRLPRFVGEGHGPPADLAATRLAGWSPCFSSSRRAGVHARRTLAISKIGTLRRRGVRRDEASRPTAARVAAAVPVGPKHKNCS